MAETTQKRLDRVNRQIASSVKQFSSALEKAAENIIPSMLVELQTQLVLDLLRRVVLKTPVDTGRARGNWQVGIGEIPDGILDRTADPQAIIAAAEKKLEQLGFGEIVWVANNLEYVTFLEDGSSQQAPAGMLRLSLAELETIFK